MENCVNVHIRVPERLDCVSIIPIIQQLNEYEEYANCKVLDIDFSDTNFVKPTGLTPLLTYLKDMQANYDGLKGHIISSKNDKISDYIGRMGFYSLLGAKDPHNHIQNNTYGSFQELYSFSKITSINEIATTSENIIKVFIKDRKLENYNKAIGWCISETIDNARNHANSNINVVFAQEFEQKGICEFCVCDRGVGIRKTMGEKTVKEALLKAITNAKGINSTGMGNGLYYTSELIKNDSSGKCSMNIWSENAILTLRSGEDPIVRHFDAYWQGVIVSISMYNDISTNLTTLKGGNDIFSYDENPDYYNQLFEN